MSSFSPEQSPQYISAVSRWLPMAASLFVVTGGMLSILGWVAGIGRLIDWDGNGITIKFNAAICVTSAAIGLLVSSVYPAWRNLIRLFACITIAITTATLFQYLTGVDLHIDTLIFQEAPNAAATAFPGRMGIPAALSLLVLGSALVAATYESKRRWAARLGIAALGIASLSLAGYIFGASQLYSVPRLTAIALQTAIMTAVLALGIISLIREHGITAMLSRGDAGGTMFRRLLFPIIGISLVVGFIRVFAQNEGYVDTEFGTAARSLVEIALLISLLWWTAESLSRSEARARDAASVKAENETLRRISLAQESERRRIARDLHDHIGQQLTALRLKLDALSEMINETGSAGEINKVCDQAMKLDADVSLLVWQMRPGVLDSHGLMSALKSFVREWSLSNGIDAEFHTTSSERRLSPEVETNLYRIIQESLNNISKHANAKTVNITMSYLPEEVVLVIEDDGKGFNTDADGSADGGGFGLVGMRERAILVGGKLEIESEPGKGTTILVRVPCIGPTRAAAAAGSSPR